MKDFWRHYREQHLRLTYNRVHAVAKELRHREATARAAAVADAEENSYFAASLRGKARGYAEAAALVEALEHNHQISKRRRFRSYADEAIRKEGS